jgi:hypothetical protein
MGINLINGIAVRVRGISIIGQRPVDPSPIYGPKRLLMSEPLGAV